MEKPKTIFVGLDGLSPELAELLTQRGTMPNLSYMIKNGVSATSISIPPSTFPGWTSLTTGVNPGKHGVFDFVKLDEQYRLKLNSSLDVMCPRIHEILSMNGKRSVVINLPPSWPPPKINGVILADWFSPKNFVFPIEYKGDFKDYTHRVDIVDNIDSLLKSVESKIVIAERLFESEDWDFFFLMFSESDVLLHNFYDILVNKHNKKIDMVFKKIDDYLGWVVKNRPENSMIVIASDHGFGKAKWRFRVNTLLSTSGVAVRTAGQRKGFVDLLDSPTGIEQKQFKIHIPRSLLRAMNSSKTIQRIAEKTRFSVLKDIFISSEEMIIDPTFSSAFMPHEYSYGLYVNEKRVRDTSSLISQIKKTLTRVANEHNLDILRIMAPREDIYTGPYVNRAPHLVLVPNKGFFISDSAFGKTALSQVWSLDHTYTGIAIMFGDHIKKNQRLNPVPIYSITPTILFYLGVPLPHNVDAAPLKTVFIDINEGSYKKYRNYLERYRISRAINVLNMQEKMK